MVKPMELSNILLGKGTHLYAIPVSPATYGVRSLTGLSQLDCFIHVFC